MITVRANLGDITRARLAQDDLGCLELYAHAESGVLAGTVAVGPDAASWMGAVTLAIRAKISVTILADVVHASHLWGGTEDSAMGRHWRQRYGEALETAL